MKPNLDDSQPIFQQIADSIKNEIVDGHLNEGDQIPSTTELSQFYQINRATAQKGLNVLVDAGLVHKKRGIGMFVQKGAKKMLLVEREKGFYKQFVLPLLNEAKRIQLPEDAVIQMIKESKQND